MITLVARATPSRIQILSVRRGNSRVAQRQPNARDYGLGVGHGPFYHGAVSARVAHPVAAAVARGRTRGRSRCSLGAAAVTQIVRRAARLAVATTERRRAAWYLARARLLRRIAGVVQLLARGAILVLGGATGAEGLALAGLARTACVAATVGRIAAGAGAAETHFPGAAHGARRVLLIPAQAPEDASTDVFASLAGSAAEAPALNTLATWPAGICRPRCAAGAAPRRAAAARSCRTAAARSRRPATARARAATSTTSARARASASRRVGRISGGVRRRGRTARGQQEHEHRQSVAEPGGSHVVHDERRGHARFRSYEAAPRADRWFRGEPTNP